MGDPLRVRGRYREGRIELEHPIPGLMGLQLDIEISFPDGEGHAATGHVEARYAGPLVELGAELAEVGQGENAPLVKHIREFRQRLQRASGLRLPAVRIFVREDLPPSAYRVRLHLNGIAEGQVQPGRVLAVVADPKDGGRLRPLREAIAPDPIFGLPSCWIQSRYEGRARELGLTVATPASLVCGHVQEALCRHLPDCLDRDGVREILEAARGTCPRLVDAVIPERLDEAAFHALLRALLGLRCSIAPVQTLFEALDEYKGAVDEERIALVAARLPAIGVI